MIPLRRILRVLGHGYDTLVHGDRSSFVAVAVLISGKSSWDTNGKFSVVAFSVASFPHAWE